MSKLIEQIEQGVFRVYPSRLMGKVEVLVNFNSMSWSLSDYSECRDLALVIVDKHVMARHRGGFPIPLAAVLTMKAAGDEMVEIQKALDFLYREWSDREAEKILLNDNSKE